MSCLAVLLRALESQAPIGQFSTSTMLRRCCTGQAASWLNGNVQIPYAHLQQLHTSAAAALAAAAAAAVSAQAAAPQLASSSTASGNALQPVEASGVLSSLLTGLPSQQMDADHIGLYYDFNKALVPEAFQAFHQAFYSPRSAKQQRKGGCRSLQAEFTLTHSSGLMWRRCTQELQQALSSGSVPRVHLQGAAGAGKSIAVVQMVEWARSNGWIALYVPSAAALIRGGFFYKRGDSDTYDTIISAQHILKSMADSHTADLIKLQLQLPASKQLLKLTGTPSAGSSSRSSSGSDAAPQQHENGPDAAAVVPAGGGVKEGKKGKKGSSGPSAADVEGTLMQLVVAGLSTDEDGELAVECCLCLIKELAAVSDRQPVLLAVDDCNALYWKTEYGRTVFIKPKNTPEHQYRTEVPVEQLNLARSMRLLERSDLGAARVLVADSASNRVPSTVVTPSGDDAGVYFMPRFSEVETAHALYYYHERGLTGAAPSACQVAAMRALTNGSGADLRKWCLKVTQTDMGLL